jgi:DNA polymerase-3 subunit gamma/tau
MSQALYRKWRPQTWDEVVGQGPVVGTLRNALAAGRTSHAYLFAGPRGTGKTTTARLLAKAMNCTEADPAKRPCGQCDVCQAVAQGRFMDLIEIDAASNTSVEDVRDLRDKINFAPNLGKYKVYIIDEVHMLSTAAFNALLKTLEEPPPHAIFILATTEVHKIPATVLSRCQRHEFRRIPVRDIVDQLTRMAAEEGIQVAPEALALIAKHSTGAMRDAISLLDQLASTGQAITLEMAQEVLGAAASQAVLDVVQALVDRQADAGLDRIHAALDAGTDPRQFARQIVDYLRDLLLILMGNPTQVDATQEVREVMARHVQFFQPADLLRVLRIFNTAASESRNPWQPSLPLEMAFVEALNPPATPEHSIEPAARPAVSRPAVTGSMKAQPATRSAPPAQPQAADGAQAFPAEEPPAAQPTGAAEPADSQLNKRLAESWNKILAFVRTGSPPAYGAINSCTSKSMRGNYLILTFASEVVKSKVEKPESLALLQRALQQVFGQEINVQCLVDTARRDTVPPGVDQDGIVATAMRDLGGELVDIN